VHSAVAKRSVAFLRDTTVQSTRPTTTRKGDQEKERGQRRKKKEEKTKRKKIASYSLLITLPFVSSPAD
jgi:hypothetical protein